ncbi:MAG: hypothetical protein OXF74_07295 [Rhodobacteraceae bacterium]|nr:hypothetical protein [Paracoccaceae bacterium]
MIKKLFFPSPHWRSLRDSVDPARISGSLGRLRTALFLIGCLALIGAVGFAAITPPTVEPSRLAKIPHMDSTPGGQHQRDSQRYRETLRQANINQAEEANSSGQSFVSSPEGLPEQLPRPAVDPLPGAVGDERDAIAANAEVARQIAETAQMSQDMELRPLPEIREFPGPEDDANPFLADILRQMGAIARATEIPGIVSVTLHGPSAEPSTDENSVDGDDAARLIRISAGTVLAGEILTQIDSDVPAPVAVRLLAGAAAGSILIGEFKTLPRQNGVAIEFASLTHPQGVETGVMAMAVDPLSRSASLAGEVDPRPVARYGPTMLSAFVGGFAQNAARPGVTLFDSASGIFAASGKPTMRDNVIAGIGQAANLAASDYADNAPDSARIRLFAGDRIGILFLTPVQISLEQAGADDEYRR